MIPRANGVTVTVTQRTATGVDAYGDPTFTAATFDICGCVLAPATGTELDAQGRTGAAIVATLYIPANDHPALRHNDTVTVGEDVYDVETPPKVWRNPSTGITRGIEVGLRRVVG